MLCCGGRWCWARCWVAAPELQTADVRLNNVKPNLMAYWFDPAHQAMPQELRSFLKSGGYRTRFVDKLTREPGNVNGPRDLKLPAGVTDIVAIDPRNILRARGTAAGLEALQKLVAQIDVPLNTVEVEAQLWEVAPADLKALSLKLIEMPDPEIYEGSHAMLTQTGLAVFPDAAPTVRALENLQTKGRASLYRGPRVTIHDYGWRDGGPIFDHERAICVR